MLRNIFRPSRFAVFDGSGPADLSFRRLFLEEISTRECTMAIRRSVGSFWSRTRMSTSSSADLAAHSEAISNILSTRTVLLFGVPRSRPPRRSPIFEPLGMLIFSQCLGSWRRVGERRRRGSGSFPVAQKPVRRRLPNLLLLFATVSLLVCYSGATFAGENGRDGAESTPNSLNTKLLTGAEPTRSMPGENEERRRAST